MASGIGGRGGEHRPALGPVHHEPGRLSRPGVPAPAGVARSRRRTIPADARCVSAGRLGTKV